MGIDKGRACSSDNAARRYRYRARRDVRRIKAKRIDCAARDIFWNSIPDFPNIRAVARFDLYHRGIVDCDPADIVRAEQDLIICTRRGADNNPIAALLQNRVLLNNKASGVCALLQKKLLHMRRRGAAVAHLNAASAEGLDKARSY